jgi:hypothetical protein
MLNKNSKTNISVVGRSIARANILIYNFLYEFSPSTHATSLTDRYSGNGTEATDQLLFEYTRILGWDDILFTIWCRLLVQNWLV